MDRLTRIREQLARLAELTTDELTELRTDIGDAFDEFDALPTTPENVGILNELADAGEQVMARGAEIEAEARANEEAKEAARARRAKLNGEAEDEAEETEADEPAAEEAAADLEPVAASGKPAVGSSPSRMARQGRSVEASPELNDAAATHLVASGRGHGARAGEVIDGRYPLARLLSQTLGRMKPTDKATGDVVIASAEWTFPEDRILTDDNERNAEIIDAVCHPAALVATGGICAPVNVDYSLGTWAVADRPLRDGLPAFQATRGGLTFRTPPTIASLAGASGIWTEATDANPAGATKPVLAIACPTPQTVYINAVTTRVGFGNMESQFDPETVAANTDLAIAAAARKAEVELLTLIAGSATLDITTAQVLGAARDFLATAESVVAQYRNIHRLSDSQVLTMVLPRWVKNYIRIDRARELAHDSVGVDPLAIPDEWIESALALRGIKPIWTLESLPSSAYGAGYPAQDFSGFTAASALPAFPVKTVWHIFPEGAIQFLDGGRLDLGVVRDSTLDSTNDYETFVETFEGIANRAFSGGVLQIVSSLCANGATGATATVGSCI